MPRPFFELHLLNIENLSISLGQNTILDSVSLSVNAGEMVALVGESGCGKSTLARTKLRLYEAHSGTIRLDDVDVTALKPRLLIADESVSALNVSIQSEILNLLADLQKKLGLASLFISHDLSLVRHISSRIALIYLDHVVETGDTESVISHLQHPYTQALMSAVPGWSAKKSQRIFLQGELPDPANPPKGCVFSTRCAKAMDHCHDHRPVLASRIALGGIQNVNKTMNFNACHLYKPTQNQV